MLAAFSKRPAGALDFDNRRVQIFSLGKADANMRRIPLSLRTSVERNYTTSGKRNEDQLVGDAKRLASTEHVAVEAGSALDIIDVEVNVIDGARPDHQALLKA